MEVGPRRYGCAVTETTAAGQSAAGTARHRPLQTSVRATRQQIISAALYLTAAVCAAQEPRLLTVLNDATSAVVCTWSCMVGVDQYYNTGAVKVTPDKWIIKNSL